jgi:hypothetical protein
VGVPNAKHNEVCKNIHCARHCFKLILLLTDLRTFGTGFFSGSFLISFSSIIGSYSFFSLGLYVLAL